MDALPAAQRARAARRHRWIGAVLLVVVAGLVVLRCELADERGKGRLELGYALVVRGLEGGPGAFEEAEQVLASAAGLTDPYPLFVLEASRRLRERRFDDATPAVRAVFELLVQRRYDDALKAVSALSPTLAGRAELARLVTDLAGVAHAR